MSAASLRNWCFVSLWLAAALARGNEQPASPEFDLEAIEASGAVIRNILFDRGNVFDPSNPGEDKSAYRWANRFHVVTAEDVIESQLLFERGDVLDARLLEESERILRANNYIIDAVIEPVAFEGGQVDLVVRTRDVWSLTPNFSLSRSGGENRTTLGVEEVNLLGRGQVLRAEYVDTVDRERTEFEFEDRNLFNSWWWLRLRAADNSDGDSAQVALFRPFHSLDARRSGGGWLSNDERRVALYRLGEEAAEFRQEREFHTVFAGWSAGLRDGWTRRWTVGYVHDDRRFSDALDPILPAAIPEDRNLRYPYIGIELLEDDYDEAENVDAMGRVEDVHMGTRFTAQLGWSDRSFGADRDALLASFSGNLAWGSLSREALLLRFDGRTRVEDGDARNALVSFDARYYRRQSERRTFFATVAGAVGHDLDLDNPIQLGGRSGLRGYRLRYQSGDARLLFSLEQRFFTDWYPFRLARLGGAIFADVGRTWGVNRIGEENQGWLRDVGFGLRIAPVRFGTNRVVHIDFAFPLDGDDDIDGFQVLLRARRSF